MPLARYLASEHGREAAQIGLVGAIAEAYFAQQLADEQRQLAERTLTDWRQSLALARLLKQAEQNSDLDVAQAEGQVALAEADLEARRRAQAQASCWSQASCPAIFRQRCRWSDKRSLLVCRQGCRRICC